MPAPTLRPSGRSDQETRHARPEAFLEALAAVLDGRPEASVEIVDGIFVRSAYWVDACAPFTVETLDRAARFVESGVLPDGPSSIASDVVLQVRA